MKKPLITALLLAAGFTTANAQVLLYETFTYPDGNITNVSGGLWKVHSGTSGDSLVSGNRYQVFGTRADDVNRTFTGGATNSGVIFAAWTLNMSSLPVNSNGQYFAHFKDSGNIFHGRVYAVTGVNGLVANWNVAPGFYRIGVANAAADGTGLIGTGPNRVFPQDLALNVDYQIVVEYDPAQGGQVWVNPEFATDPNTGFSSDTSAASTNGVSAYAFRQSTGQGQQKVDNLVVGYTFNDVVTNIPFAAPVIAIQPVGTTNYSGNAYTISAIVTGPGALSYQWYSNSVAIPGANSSAYSIAALGAGDDGSYTLVVTNDFGSTTSAPPAIISVNTTPTPPFFITTPAGVTNQISNPLTLAPTVGGTGPLTFQWNLNGSPAPDASSTSQTYTHAQCTTNDSGIYTLVVSGSVAPTATSSNINVQVNPASAVSIGFLRGLENTNTWTPTDTTTLWSITGTVINPTSPTSSTTSSYYVQDATGGINLFITGTTAFRPALGDVVTAVGPLASFSQNLELSLNAANTFHTFSDTGVNVPLPAPFVFSPTNTNNLPFMEALESSFILMTNVYFKTGGGTNKFLHGTTYVITNKLGIPFSANIGTIVSNLDGVAIPTFANSLTGVLIQNNSTTNLKAGYQIMISQLSDITTVAPSPVTVGAAISGGNAVLSWTAQPYHYSYSVLSASDIAGPFTTLVQGLTFTNPAAAYTIPLGAGSVYYRITSP